MQQLVRIDSLAKQLGDKKALIELDKIIPETFTEEENIAYYWLLRIRTELNLHRNIKSVYPLEQSIQYYRKCNNIKKLSRALLYKGSILNENGQLKEAVTCLKEVENLIKNNDEEILLADYVYSTLSKLNYKAKEKRLAIEYAKLALKQAYITGDNYNIAHDLMTLFVDYNDINNKDSALFYLNKCILLLESIPQNERHTFYANIGNAYIDTDVAKAEDYLNQSIAINHNVFAYKGLARIYYKRGEKEKAREMWQQALKTDNMYLRAEVLQAMYESQRDEEDYKTASETAMLIAALKDSIAQKERTDNIRGLQEQFDQEQRRLRDRAKSDAIIYGVVALLLLAVALTLYFYTRNAKGKERLAKTQQQLEQYRNRLIVMEKEGKTDTKEVEQLTQKIAELQAKQGALLQNGRERYEEAMAGGTTIRWNRNDFSDCIEYYRTQDAAFVAHMETSYRHLSSKYMFFALMEHLGHTDEELQHIMAISQSTVRSYRSRINSAVIKTE